MYLLNEVISGSSQARLVAVYSFRVAVIISPRLLKKNEANIVPITAITARSIANNIIGLLPN